MVHHLIPFYVNWVFWLYAALLMPFALFVGFYAARTPDWRRSPEGRALMILAGSIVAVLAFALFAQVTTIPPPVRNGLRAFTLGGVGVAGWYLLLNLLRLQREARRNECPATAQRQETER